MTSRMSLAAARAIAPPVKLQRLGMAIASREN
jgi:hypothetical protein